MTEMGVAALHYADMGLAVIPLKPRDKKPLFDNWTEIGTCDKDLVTRWWTSNPMANVGILTGQKSHCFVLDVDPKNGGRDSYEDLLFHHGQFPDTWQDTTGGSGGGFHLYFRYPNFEIRNAAGLFPGIDIRGNGGQVVAPPSIHPDTGRRYEWDGAKEIDHTPLAEAPLWLLDLLHARAERTHSDKFPIDVRIPHGVQHETLVALAGKLRQLGLSAEEIKPTLHAVHRGRCEKPGPEKNIDKIAESMMKYRPSDGDLLSVANRLWRVTKAKECEAKERKDRLTPVSIDGLTVYRVPAAEQECVIEGLLFNGLTVFAGRPKIGKSYLVLQLAMSVAMGRRFLDAREVLRPGGVVYAALEESQSRTSKRMKQFQSVETPLLQNIEIIYDLLPMLAGGLVQLKEAIEKHRPVLVVIDTFLAFVGVGAKQRDVLRADYAEMQAIHELAEKHDTAILVIHHMRKPTVGGNGLDAVAGTTGLTAAADNVWTMQREDGGLCSLEMVGRESEEQTFALRFRQGDPFGWELIATGAHVKDMNDEREIQTLLKNEGALSPGRIANMLHLTANRTRSLLYELHRQGILNKNTAGSYCIALGRE